MPTPGAGAELARVPMFARVDPALLAAVDQFAFVRRLARGQVLFVAGEPAEHLFVLRSGALKVHLTSAQGGELLLALLSAPAALGDVSLVDRGPRSAGATALSDVELLAVPLASLRELLTGNATAAWAVAESLAAGVRRLTDRAADLVFLDLPRRLAKLLLDSAVGDVAHLPVTQTELAAMLGVSRQALNKALSGLASRDWVGLDDHAARLLDRPAMERFVRT